MSHVPYASAVGSIMYAMVCTQPDISHAISVVSQYMDRPGKGHWQAVKWILRYLKGSTNIGLCFDRGIILIAKLQDIRIQILRAIWIEEDL